MVDITNIPAPRVPFIDDRTGLMAREWYRFFINIFMLTGGGTTAVTLTDLQVAPQVHPQISDNQTAQLMARYSALLSAVEGISVAPSVPHVAPQFDPLSYCAPR